MKKSISVLSLIFLLSIANYLNGDDCEKILDDLELSLNKREHLITPCLIECENEREMYSAANSFMDLALNGKYIYQLSTSHSKRINLIFRNMSMLEESERLLIFDDLRRIRSLDLSNNMLSKLTNDTFNGLHGLYYLNLRSNLIEIIDTDAFMSLKNLKSIILSGNLLNELDFSRFTHLFGLCDLVIDMTFYGSLHANLLQNYSNLHRFTIENYMNKNFTSLTIVLRDIERGAFNGLVNLKHLNITCKTSHQCLDFVYYQEITSLESLCVYFQSSSGSFEIWKSSVALNLKSFKILGANFNTLSSYMFNSSLKSLRKLSLFTCRIRIIEENAFYGLTELEHLELSDNFINRIDNGAFKALFNLKSLALQKNRLIDTLAKNVLSDLNNIVSLDISNNELASISSDYFRNHQVTVKVIKIDQRTIKLIEKCAFANLNSIELIDLYESRFSEMRMERESFGCLVIDAK